MHRRLTGQLVIATHNPGKLSEMRELLAPYGVSAISAGELGLGEPEETGDSFRANAAIKAVAAAQAAKLPAFADDSGLVVDALDGEPGAAQRALREFDDEHYIAGRRPLGLAGIQGLPVPGRLSLGPSAEARVGFIPLPNFIRALSENQIDLIKAPNESQ